MTSKLPWATAATILVIAAVGASLWLWPAAEEGVTPTPTPTPTPTGQWVPIGFAAGTGGGIENVYFMDNDNAWVLTADLNSHENLLENSDGVDIVMTDDSTFTSSYVPYDDGFALVVALTLKETDNVYATYKDNFKVELTFDGFGPENSSDDDETLFSGSEGDATIRVNVEFDNDHVVTLGASKDITVKLWTWQAA